MINADSVRRRETCANAFTATWSAMIRWNRRVLGLLLAGLFLGAGCSTPPPWYYTLSSDELGYQQYYYVGKGHARIVDDSSALTNALKNAMGDAALQVSSVVSKQTVMVDTELDAPSSQAAGVQYYAAMLDVRSTVILNEVERFKITPKGRALYVMAGAPRTAVHQSLATHAGSVEAESARQVDEILKEADRKAESGRLRLYEDAATQVLRALDHALIRAAAQETGVDDARREKFGQQLKQFEDRLSDRADLATSASEAAERLADRFDQENRRPMAGCQQKAVFHALPFVSGNSGFVAPFGRDLARLVAGRLERTLRWQESVSPDHAAFILSGQITQLPYRQGALLTLVSQCALDGQTRVTSVYVDAETASRIGRDRLLPESHVTAYDARRIMAKNRREHPDLRVEARSDRTQGALWQDATYRVRERPCIEARVSDVCHLRVLCILPGERRATLLVDNLRIPARSARRWIDVRARLRLDRTGPLLIMVQASPEPFAPVDTRNEYLAGLLYRWITDLPGYLTRVRAEREILAEDFIALDVTDATVQSF